MGLRKRILLCPGEFKNSLLKISDFSLGVRKLRVLHSRKAKSAEGAWRAFHMTSGKNAHLAGLPFRRLHQNAHCTVFFFFFFFEPRPQSQAEHNRVHFMGRLNKTWSVRFSRCSLYLFDKRRRKSTKTRPIRQDAVCRTRCSSVSRWEAARKRNATEAYDTLASPG